MSPIRHFDHVGITVRDLDTVTAFFVGLGFETEGRMVLEGEFLDTGYRLIGGVGQYEGVWRMASVRGPEGFIVNLAQRIN
jgi:catechol 2,3-dioxygenase-like lactoylglutathione lyase family enzyme